MSVSVTQFFKLHFVHTRPLLSLSLSFSLVTVSQLVKKNPELKKKFLSMAQAMKEGIYMCICLPHIFCRYVYTMDTHICTYISENDSRTF